MSEATALPIPAAEAAAAVAGFDELFARERRAMVRLAYLMVGSEALAEEIVQDAFARVFERWRRLERPGGYLRQCVVNGCRRHLRRRQVELRVRTSPAPPEAPADDSADLLAVLDVLSPKRRAVVVLRFYGQLSQDEVAQVLGVRVGTVKSMLHRALAELREVVER